MMLQVRGAMQPDKRMATIMNTFPCFSDFSDTLSQLSPTTVPYFHICLFVFANIPPNVKLYLVHLAKIFTFAKYTNPAPRNITRQTPQ